MSTVRTVCLVQRASTELEISMPLCTRGTQEHALSQDHTCQVRRSGIAGHIYAAQLTVYIGLFAMPGALLTGHTPTGQQEGCCNENCGTLAATYNSQINYIHLYTHHFHAAQQSTCPRQGGLLAILNTLCDTNPSSITCS